MNPAMTMQEKVNFSTLLFMISDSGRLLDGHIGLPMVADGVHDIRQLGWMRAAVVRLFRIGRRFFMVIFHKGGDFLLRLFVVEPPVDGAEGRQFDVPLRPTDDDGGVEAFVNGGSGCAADGCEDAAGIADERRRVVFRLDDALVGHVVALRDDAFGRTEEIVDQIDEMDDLRDEHAAAFAVPFAVPVVAVVGIRTEAAEIDGGVENLSETAAVQQLLEQQVAFFVAMLEDSGEDEFGMLFVGGEHGVKPFQRVGQAFFADDVLAGVHGGDGKWRMAGVIRADVDEVDFRIVQ